MDRRPYGDTGVQLSLVGFGGVVIAGVSQAEADRAVAEAIARGVNWFDVAPTYGDAEERLGPALEAHRGEVFLNCKTAERAREAADRELETSLRRLRTDHVDLYQLHGLTSQEDIEAAFGPGGAVETLQAARQAGKARFLGFSAHSERAALEAMRRFDFDSILFPINFVCWHHGFGPAVVEEARRRGVTCLAIKALARGPYPPGAARIEKCWYQPFQNRDEAELALRWTLSQPVAAAIPPGNPSLFRLAVELAAAFQPLSIEEHDQLRQTAQDIQPVFGES